MDNTASMIAVGSVLVAVVSYFLQRFMKQFDKIADSLTKMDRKLEVLVVRFENDAEALRRHESDDEKEHGRIRSDIETLGSRDHELANLVHACWNILQLDGKLPDMPPISRRAQK